MLENVKKLKRAIIKEELIALTGNFVDAVILNQFIYWAERVKDVDAYIQQENERAKQYGTTAQNPQELTEGWIYKTAEELSEETMLGQSDKNMRRHIKSLIDAGYIDERTNPKYKWDRTKQYRVNLVKIVDDLRKIGYQLDGYHVIEKKMQEDKMTNGQDKMSNQSDNMSVQNTQNVGAIPEITSEITAETTVKKESKKAKSFDEIISSYTQNQNVKDAIVEYIKMRKLIKAPMTDRALTTLLNKLSGLAKTDDEKIAVLNQAIEHSWKSVYPLETQRKSTQQKSEKQGDVFDIEAEAARQWGEA